jgi:ribosomal-protein-alanine N-acetyltransferase
LTEVRIASERDFPAITRIQLRAPEAAQWPLGDYSGCSLFLATVDDQPAGFCAWRQTLKDEAELLNIAVDPDHRRKGVGSRLIEALLEAAQGGIFLEVAESNPRAIALYRKYGWMEAGTRKGYYDQGKINALVMKKCS